jgi:hypothetical protein
MRKHSWFIASLALSCLLTACLRGEVTIGNNSGGSTGGGGSGGSGSIAVGTVTGFGSVFVDGTEYASSGANVIIDGSTNHSDSALLIGMVVTVKGTLNSGNATGSASTIEYNPDLRGPLDAAPAISKTSGNFSIFGQTVLTDATTIFDTQNGLSDFSAGTTAEVSGYRDEADLLHATRVAQTLAGSDLEIKGSIANLTATTLTLGSLTVNFASATHTNFPSAGLSNGLRVKVRAATQPVNSVLTATNLEVLPTGAGAGEGQQVQIRGFVSTSSSNSLTVNGQVVSTSTATVYENGTAGDVAVGVALEAEGTVTGGVLAATKVRFQLVDDVALVALVTSVDIAGSKLTVFNTPGIVVKVDANTMLNDNSGVAARPFKLNNLTVGDRVSVLGSKDGGNSLQATRVLRTSSNSQVSLEGPVSSATAPVLTILGINVATNASTRYLDTSGNSLNQAEFFDLTSTGVSVTAQGTFTGTTIIADQVQID